MSFYNDLSNKNDFDIRFKDKPKQAFGIFAKSYHIAAKRLAEDMLEKHFRVYEPYPVIFLYRHSIELHLKNIIIKTALLSAFREIKNLDHNLQFIHQLDRLTTQVKIIILKLFPREMELNDFIENKLEVIVKEFTEIDPNSSSFRYPIDRNENCSTLTENNLNLESIYNNLEPVLKRLEKIEFGINIETDNEQKIYEIHEILNAI
ncbi:hypothetical protein ACFLSQ_02275 [Bacteroidota bacterium]